jgi:hypothetical protein
VRDGVRDAVRTEWELEDVGVLDGPRAGPERDRDRPVGGEHRPVRAEAAAVDSARTHTQSTARGSESGVVTSSPGIIAESGRAWVTTAPATAIPPATPTRVSSADAPCGTGPNGE